MAQITLFNEANGGGRKLTLTSENSRLTNNDFNDTTVSIHVESGTWILYTGKNFEGKMEYFSEGGIIELPDEMKNSLSSLRPMPDEDALVLFEDSNFQGRAVVVTDDIEHLSDVTFNDAASSSWCTGGSWKVWQDAKMEGDSYEINGPSHIIDAGGWDRNYGNDSISSVQKL